MHGLLAAIAFDFLLAPALATAQAPTPPTAPVYYPPPPPGYPPPPSGYYPPPPGYPVFSPPQPLVRAANAIFVELSLWRVSHADHFIWSFNYERFFADAMSVRMGFGSFSAPARPVLSARMPFQLAAASLNYFVGGHSSHKLELGGGCLYLYDASALGSLTMGYRYSPYAGGLVFRAGSTVIFDRSNLAHWWDVSFGSAF